MIDVIMSGSITFGANNSESATKQLTLIAKEIFLVSTLIAI